MAYILQKLPTTIGVQKMNYLPNFKIDKLAKELNNVELEIAKNCDKLIDSDIRTLVDNRRHLLAILTREFLVENKNKNSVLPAFPRTELQTEQFINAWCDQIKTLRIMKTEEEVKQRIQEDLQLLFQLLRLSYMIWHT